MSESLQALDQVKATAIDMGIVRTQAAGCRDHPAGRLWPVAGPA